MSHNYNQNSNGNNTIIDDASTKNDSNSKKLSNTSLSSSTNNHTNLNSNIQIDQPKLIFDQAFFSALVKECPELSSCSNYLTLKVDFLEPGVYIDKDDL